jgi:ferric-chelate reductase
LLRIVRLAYGNFKVKFSGNILKCTDSLVSYNKEANVIKIEITPAHRLMRPRPGQHYFIYKPLSLKGWENHPFTLGHWDRDSSTALPQMSDQVTGVDSKEIKVSESPTSPITEASSLAAPSITDAHRPGRLTFWIRPFDGWTNA